MGILLGIILLLALFVTVNKFWCFWCRSKVCLAGKTALVTGGASGIGFQVVAALAAKGCRIIIADIENLTQSVEKVKKLSYNPNIIGMKVDLASFKSVRQFAKEFLDSEQRLDIVVCNAGIPDCKERIITEDGLDRTMQVNYFSHFLLVHLLLDILKKSSPSRIVFTSSILAFISNVKLDRLTPPPDYYKMLVTRFNGGCYSNSKLCMAGAAKVFGQKLKGSGVTANANLVSGVKTPIFRKSLRNDRNLLSIYLGALVYVLGKTPEEGAQTLIHLAHADEVKDTTGQCFTEGRGAPRPLQLTDEFCKRLWDASIELTQLQPHEVKC